jgi:hypothetical protein
MVSKDKLDILDLALIAGNAALVARSEILQYGARFVKVAKHTSSLTGQQWVDNYWLGTMFNFITSLACISTSSINSYQF